VHVRVPHATECDVVVDPVDVVVAAVVDDFVVVVAVDDVVLHTPVEHVDEVDVAVVAAEVC